MNARDALDSRLLTTMRKFRKRAWTAREWNGAALASYGDQGKVIAALKRLSRRGSIKTDRRENRRVYWLD